MPLSPRLLFLALLAVCGLAACATAVATPPHPLLTARRPVPAAQPADSSLQRQARQLLIRGITHARLGDHERALEFYQQAMEIAPDEPAVLSAVASAYEALDDRPSALLYAERAVRLGPENAAYWLHWTDLLRREGLSTALDESITNMLDRFPDEPEVLRTAINHRIERERVEEALRLATRLAETHTAGVPWEALLPHLSAERHADLLERGLRYQLNARPDQPDPYVRLAQLYLRTDRPAEALDVLEAGRLNAGPDDALLALLSEARSTTGATASEAASPAEKVAEARRLLAEAPSPTDRERADRLLNEALAAEPDRPDALALAGRLAYETGDYQAAVGHLQRALANNPRDVALWELAAQAQLAAGDAADALETLDEALLLFPGQSPLLLARSRAHLALNEPGKADADVQRAAGISVTEVATPAEPPADGRDVEHDTPASTEQRGVERTLADDLDELEALTLAGRHAYEAGDFPTAAERLQRALQLNPRDVRLWELAVQYQLAAGDAEGALETLDRALMLFPRNPRLLVQRAKSHLALGRTKAAQAYAWHVIFPYVQASDDAAPAAVVAAAYAVYGEAKLAQGQKEQAREAWRHALELTPDDPELQRRLQKVE